MHHTKIRRGVFETNSSSTHSISIASGAETLDRLWVDDAGVCRIEPGEFSWEVEDYRDAATKASYAMVWAFQYGKPAHRTMLRNVIKENAEAKKVVFGMTDDEFSPRGYIDHQSQDVAEEAFASEETLRSFIFNMRSTLHTDNDNR